MVGRPHELVHEDLTDLEASLPSTAFVPNSSAVQGALLALVEDAPND